jgi:hypothetical protein
MNHFSLFENHFRECVKMSWSIESVKRDLSFSELALLNQDFFDGPKMLLGGFLWGDLFFQHVEKIVQFRTLRSSLAFKN